MSGEDPYYRIIDALFIPVTDSNNRAISDTLGFHTDMNLFPYGIPHTKDLSSFKYYLRGIERVKEKLEEITGNSISDQRLKEAIELCNREKALLRDISLMRKNDPSPISGKEFAVLNHASFLFDKSVALETLESLSKELKGNGVPHKKGPRLLFTGSTLAMGDYKVLDLIEEAGGTVVIEEFAEGLKPYWQNVKTTGDPLEALAEAYFMERIAPAWFRPGSDRLQYLVQLAGEFNVSGVIWYQLMYRESYKIESYYFPEILKKETGLSMLTLESDYDPSETGQLRTRIETYIETLRR
jgi:benzoyl-CoA reductase/2-hydroxyglutaryl-CoA dehydratase subunit BcrC/BadD/HgdB